MLKPDVWQDEAMADVSRDARLLFIGLITQADDAGRLRANPRRLRAQIFPHDTRLTEERIEQWLEELHGAGLIRCYTDEGRSLACLPSWKRHQTISHPSKDVLPAPVPERSGGFQSAPPKRSKRTKRTKTPPKSPPGGNAVEAVFAHWQERLAKPQARLTRERRRKIRARLDEGYSVERIKRAVDGCARSKWHRGQNDRDREYVDLTLICASGSKLEQFEELAKPPNGTGDPKQAERRIRQHAERLVATGQVDEEEALDMAREAAANPRVA